MSCRIWNFGQALVWCVWDFCPFLISATKKASKFLLQLWSSTIGARSRCTGEPLHAQDHDRKFCMWVCIAGNVRDYISHPVEGKSCIKLSADSPLLRPFMISYAINMKEKASKQQRIKILFWYLFTRSVEFILLQRSYIAAWTVHLRCLICRVHKIANIECGKRELYGCGIEQLSIRLKVLKWFTSTAMKIPKDKCVALGDQCSWEPIVLPFQCSNILLLMLRTSWYSLYF